jgi:hypothetical protein
MLVTDRLAGLSTLEAHYAGSDDARNARPPQDDVASIRPRYRTNPKTPPAVPLTFLQAA